MTDREQLTEIRKSIILNKMAGCSENQKHRAVRDLDRMQFTDHADFVDYVNDNLGGNTSEPDRVKEATDEEIDEIISGLFPGQAKKSTYTPKPGEASQSEIEEVFKHLNL